MAPKHLPSNSEAERCVLGAILIDHGALDIVTPMLTVDDFYSPASRSIYQAMNALAGRGDAIDVVTIWHQVQAQGESRCVPKGIEGISALADRYGIAHNVEHHAKLVRACGMQRRVIATCQEITIGAYDEVEDIVEFGSESESKLAEAVDGMRISTLRTSREIIMPAFDSAVKNRSADGVLGLPTGIARLDTMTSGLLDGELTVIAARPSMGKTAFALNIVERATMPLPREDRTPCPALVFSMEMTGEELLKRMMATHARVDSADMRSGKLDKGAMERLIAACQDIANAPLQIDDAANKSPNEMRAIARRWKANRKLFPAAGPSGLIVVDYLQLGRGDSKSRSREQEISEISRGLKAMAKECKCPVVALSQLNRNVDNRDDHRPRLADIRESGAIEQDADTILFLFRAEAYVTDSDENAGQKRAELDGKAEMIVAKQRNGPIGTVHAVFIKKYMKFEPAFHDR